MGYKLKDQIAGARLIVLPDCMHSIQTERPQECVRIIREFGTGSLNHALPQTQIATSAGSSAGNCTKECIILIDTLPKFFD